MFDLNKRIINNTVNVKLNKSAAIQSEIEEQTVDNDLELSSCYAHILQQYQHLPKWIIFINPNRSSMEQLTHFEGVNVSKALCVKINPITVTQSKKTLALITQVLKKGNCSAIVLSNPHGKTEDMTQLEICAASEKSHCVMLTNKNSVH